MTRVCCAIPVFNNARTIADVVRRCLRQISDVIVVDDGSTDADLTELLKPLGVSVVRHPHNLGKGEAIKTALREAHRRGFENVITLDGDGQHFPEDIPQFLSRLGPETIFIGHREEVVGTMPPASLFGRDFSDFWVCVETGRKVRDTQSGFRAYPVKSVLGLPVSSRHYNFEVEVVTRAIWAGMKIESVPIRVEYQEGAERVSSFDPLRDNARLSWMHARLVLRQVLPIPHRRNVGRERKWNLAEFLTQNSTPLGLAFTAAISALLGILLWPWGIVAVAYFAVRLHLNKIAALITLALCMPEGLARLCARIGRPMVQMDSSFAWARFVGAHVVALVAVPAAAILVYAVARTFQRSVAREHR
jgi:glycosyltransferase involved in cell wall biosynthesis